MFKFLQKNFRKLIIPICFIIGIIRRQQIEAYEASIRKPTMTGEFTFFFYLFAGTCLTIITLLLDGIYQSNMIHFHTKVENLKSREPKYVYYV